MLNTLKVGFIGGGNMATALIQGMQAKGLPGSHITLVEPYAPTRDALLNTAKQTGWQVLPACEAVLSTLDVIVLAVKPQQLRAALQPLQPFLTRQLLISVAAGIRMRDISRWLNGYPTIIRTMPNTPALVGQGMTGLVALPDVSAQQRAQASAMLQAVGHIVWVDDERDIDAITALSGSGPAYVFYFIEAMQQAAQQMGLSAQAGRDLAVATFTGAAALAAQSNEDVALLRERVTSKGGTTYAALCSLQQASVSEHIVTAIQAAQQRAAELGDEFGKD